MSKEGVHTGVGTPESAPGPVWSRVASAVSSAASAVRSAAARATGVASSAGVSTTSGRPASAVNVLHAPALHGVDDARATATLGGATVEFLSADAVKRAVEAELRAVKDGKSSVAAAGAGAATAAAGTAPGASVALAPLIVDEGAITKACALLQADGVNPSVRLLCLRMLERDAAALHVNFASGSGGTPRRVGRTRGSLSLLQAMVDANASRAVVAALTHAVWQDDVLGIRASGSRLARRESAHVAHTGSSDGGGATATDTWDALHMTVRLVWILSGVGASRHSGPAPSVSVDLARDLRQTHVVVTLATVARYCLAANGAETGAGKPPPAADHAQRVNLTARVALLSVARLTSAAADAAYAQLTATHHAPGIAQLAVAAGNVAAHEDGSRYDALVSHLADSLGGCSCGFIKSEGDHARGMVSDVVATSAASAWKWVTGDAASSARDMEVSSTAAAAGAASTAAGAAALGVPCVCVPALQSLAHLCRFGGFVGATGPVPRSLVKMLVLAVKRRWEPTVLSPATRSDTALAARDALFVLSRLAADAAVAAELRKWAFDVTLLSRVGDCAGHEGSAAPSNAVCGCAQAQSVLAGMGRAGFASRVLRASLLAAPMGVRVLSLDGGGIRGLATIAMLMEIERLCGRPVHMLFDMITGTSTGALLAVALGVERWSLERCASMYELLGATVFEDFSRVELLNVARMAVTRARHDPTVLVAMLKRLFASASHPLMAVAPGVDVGVTRLPACEGGVASLASDALSDAEATEEARSELRAARRGRGACHVCVVATDVRQRPVKPFVFRNYCHEGTRNPLRAATGGGSAGASSIGDSAAGVSGAYDGTCSSSVWQALRASTAAPGFFPTFSMKHGGESHHLADGALVANNPAAIAVAEAAAAFPGTPVGAVVSVGTGRFAIGDAAVSWAGLLDILRERTTDTESTDRVLASLLPATVYSRLNPVISPVMLSESDPSKLAQLREVARKYAREALAGDVGKRLRAQLLRGGLPGGWQPPAVTHSRHVVSTRAPASRL